MTDLSRMSDEELRALYSRMARTGPGTVKQGDDPFRRSPFGEYDPTSGMTEMQKLRSGIGQGMTNVFRHGGNLVGAVSDEALADAKALDAPLMAQPSGRLGSMVGETAVTAPLMMAGGAALGATGVGARAMANPIARGAIEGAGQGLLMADPGEKGAGALVGGVAGAALPAAYKGIQGAMRGVQPTPDAQILMNQGVDLTPGQMNPHGALSKVEQAAQRVPVIGEAVTGARDNAKQQWQRKVIEQGLAPGAQLTSRSTDVTNLLDDAARTFDTAYDVAKGFPVKPAIMSAGADVPLDQAFTKAVSDRSVFASKSIRQSTKAWLDDQLTRLPKNPKSDDLLKLRSIIRTQARSIGGDTLEEKAARDLFRKAEGTITQALESQLPPDVMPALKAIDGQYGNFAIVREAVAKAKLKPGGFTPFNFAQAVSEATDTGTFARGGGRMADLAKAARGSFEATEPQTGLLGVGTLGLSGAAIAAEPTIGIPLAATAAGLIGTPAGRRIAAGRVKPQLMAQALERQIKAQVPKNQRELAAQYARRLMVSSQTD